MVEQAAGVAPQWVCASATGSNEKSSSRGKEERGERRKKGGGRRKEGRGGPNEVRARRPRRGFLNAKTGPRGRQVIQIDGCASDRCTFMG